MKGEGNHLEREEKEADLGERKANGGKEGSEPERKKTWEREEGRGGKKKKRKRRRKGVVFLYERRERDSENHQPQNPKLLHLGANFEINGRYFQF